MKRKCVRPSSQCRSLDSKHKKLSHLPSCLVVYWKVTWLITSQVLWWLLPSRSREGTPSWYCLNIFSKAELKEKRSTDMSTTSSEHFQVQGNSKWGVNGATTSPGPWTPLISALNIFIALWQEMLQVHNREATFNIPSPAPSLPFYPQPSLADGLKTLILGPICFTCFPFLDSFI